MPTPEALVRIWSDEHNAYWRVDGRGYTCRAPAAWVLPESEARARTAHCGPEKQINIEPATDLARFAAQRGADWRGAVMRFAEAILYGDDKHQQWLRAAAKAYVNGNEIPLVPPQTGGGDAPTDNENGRRDAERLCTRPDTAAPTISPPGAAAGCGDAGGWARAAVEALPSRFFDRKHTEEIALCLMPEFEAALRSSHREGAEAMREAIVRWHEYHAGISAPGTVRDWHKASSIHHSDMPIPGKTDAP